jgi:putative addiction module killer protein
VLFAVANRCFFPGNPGDVRPVGAGVSELRIDYGPGYRVYLIHRGPQTVVLLCGGDTSTQDRNIGRANELAKEGRISSCNTSLGSDQASEDRGGREGIP